MIDSAEVKSIVMGLGADLCGIAPVERFRDAPEGFRPTDIYDRCLSVVAFAKRVPTETLFAQNCVPYSHVSTTVIEEVDRLAVRISLALEDRGVGAVAIPCDDPYEHWEPERTYGRAILSLRHAGYLAGLGVLGKNSLLRNRDYGSMIQIGAVLVNVDLAADDIVTEGECPPKCTICIDSCPVGAMGDSTVDQQLCRPLSVFKNEKGYVLKKCNTCRRVCPHTLGRLNKVR